jgi:ankyrin repeat protein
MFLIQRQPAFIRSSINISIPKTSLPERSEAHELAVNRVLYEYQFGSYNLTLVVCSLSKLLLIHTRSNPSGGAGHLGYENSLLAARLEQQYTPLGPSELDASSSYAGSIATPTLPSATPTTPPPQYDSDKVPTSAMSKLSMAHSEGLIPFSTEPSVVAASPVPEPSLPIIERTTTPATEPGPYDKRIPITVDKSRLPVRTPKSTLGMTSAALKKTLYSAVEGKKTKVVEQLLDRGVPPDTGPETNSVFVATLNRDTPTLKLLLEFGANPDAPDKYGNTPLRVSCDCREEQARLLLEWGADPNISTPDWTALPWACDSKQEKIVSLLLQYSADPDLCSKNGETGLVYVCNRSFGPNMVREMLDWGADPNKKNARGVTPLEGACNTNQPEVVKLLVDRHADPNLVGTHLLLKGNVARPECLRVLLDAGADVTRYKGLMELATWENSIESVELLLSAGVDPNEKHQDRYSPLTTAIRDKRADIFDLLIKKGADPNAEGEDLPLRMAVLNPQFIIPLLSAGADLSKCKGIMEWAAYHNNLEVCF